MISWTEETIAKLCNQEIESLRQNAATRDRLEIVTLCDEELTRRKPVRPRKPSEGIIDDHSGQYVSEFHFVCPSELGVTRNQDGTIWTRTWVVAEEHAENALRYRALVFLHPSRAEQSYLQGTVTAWRKNPRQPRYSGDQLNQTREGIDFLFQPLAVPHEWKGDATGEKGYAWSPLPE
jgi:hypothetical protein